MLPSSDEAQIVKLLAKYKNVNATKKDVLDVLNSYRSLTYHLEKFVFNDGVFRELFNLQGTIPVVYKSNTYHIPICIWLMDTHPNNAPMCFVKPTSTMQIKVSMFVDHNGKVYLPYLHDWQPHTSDLLGLIQVMIVTFGEHPPVYSKPKGSTVQYPTSSFMPQPGASGNSFLPYPAAGGSAFPPYPTGGSFGPYPTPYPPATGVNPPTGMPSAGAAGYPPYIPFNYNAGGTPAQTGTITEEHIKASLISAVEDKLRRRIQEKMNQCQAEIETLNRTRQELVEGSMKIDTILIRLRHEENELKKNLAVLRERDQELDKSLEALEQMDGIDVDETVITTAPLYKQLLNAYAEEAATEDAIYYLSDAFRSGVIDLDTFLKHVRQLSRKQFMLRAIMQKCRQKAGLAG